MKKDMQQPRKKAYEVVIDQIKESFLNGKLPPGEKLPTERELAGFFNISRTSVREALRKLEIEGFIEIRQGSGTFIKAVPIPDSKSDFSFSIVNNKKKLIFEMLELRRVLEVECAFLASLRATTDDLEQILDSLELMRNSNDDVELGLRADVNFHKNIVRASHNSIFLQLIQSLSERMEDTIRATRKLRLTDSESVEDTFDEHKQIYLAIATGDSLLAKQLMEKHISQIRKEMTEFFLEQNRYN
ncbi:FadR/GntR family transcriptional regulator [Neobacillus rhizophilus]|nr:FadR/GntR family transcriptional regulator [Neobacillus rhizophilus]